MTDPTEPTTPEETAAPEETDDAPTTHDQQPDPASPPLSPSATSVPPRPPRAVGPGLAVAGSLAAALLVLCGFLAGWVASDAHHQGGRHPYHLGDHHSHQSRLGMAPAPHHGVLRGEAWRDRRKALSEHATRPRRASRPDDAPPTRRDGAHATPDAGVDKGTAVPGQAPPSGDRRSPPGN